MAGLIGQSSFAGRVWSQKRDNFEIRQSFTATAGQTTFVIGGGYDPTYGDVFLNGVKLVNGVDVDISDGINAVLGTGATAGDSVVFKGYGSFEVADTYTQGQTDSKFVNKDSDTGAMGLPSGTTAQRPLSPSVNDSRYNTELYVVERWNGSIWEPIGGGARGTGGNQVFYENDVTVSQDYTITSGKNAVSAGPITIDDGVTVTIPDGSTWSIT